MLLVGHLVIHPDAHLILKIVFSTLCSFFRFHVERRKAKRGAWHLTQRGCV